MPKIVTFYKGTVTSTMSLLSNTFQAVQLPTNKERPILIAKL